MDNPIIWAIALLAALLMSHLAARESLPPEIFTAQTIHQPLTHHRS